LKDSYEYVTVEKRTERDAAVALITLNRPQALNALCDALFEDLIHAATSVDSDDSIGCLVLTGSTKAFAAGADISEMKDRTFDYAYKKVGDTTHGRPPEVERQVRYVPHITHSVLCFVLLHRTCLKNGPILPKCPNR
jgi:enoyl-CoA hydratase/carnithine racemase